MDYQIFVINLERCPEKKMKMKKRLVYIDAHFINAIDGSKLTLDKLSNLDAGILSSWKDPYYSRNMTWGEVGCALSHYKIYKYCLDNNIENAIVLEDDVVIPQNFKNYVNNTLLELNKTNDWEFCYLSRKPIDEKTKDYNDTFVVPGYSYWLCAYIINLKGMRKIINSNVKKNLIAFDEFIPILSNTSPYKKYYKYFYIESPLKTYSLKDLECFPENNAFNRSETENSEIVINCTEDLLILATGTDMNDGLKRFINSCNTYGLKYNILGLGEKWKGGNMTKGPGGGQKINFLHKYIKNLDDNKIVLISDSYDVIMSANSNEILKKYESFNTDIVFASESSCWPDSSLISKYPKVNNRKNIFLNSGGFIGKVSRIKKIISMVPDNSDDQLWYSRLFLEKNNNSIALDYNCEIFQCLNCDKKYLEIDYSKSRLYNKNTGTMPCHIHGNGDIKIKLYLNHLSNYIPLQWRPNYLYKNSGFKPNYFSNIPKNKYPMVNIIFIDEGGDYKNSFKSLLDFNYPKQNIVLTIVSNKSFKQELTMYKKVIIFNKSYSNKYHIFLGNNSSDYVFFLSSRHIFTNNNTLKDLIIKNKEIISPMVMKEKSPWSNFWGDIDNNGYYSRSSDYFEIVEYKKKGCWNVPYINGSILINFSKFQAIFNALENNTIREDYDMYFPRVLRELGIFMYICNIEKYGYIK